MSIPIGIRKDKNFTTSALFGVAVIQIAVMGIAWVIHGDAALWQQMGLVDKVITYSGGIYLVLAVAARWVPVPAAVIGAVLYAAFLALQASRSLDLLTTGFIFKVPIVILLVLAVVFAWQRPPTAPGPGSA